MGVRTNAGGGASVGTLKNALQYADDDLGIDVASSSYGEICDALADFFPDLPVGTEWTFAFSGSVSKFVVPVDGIYKFDLKGAGGGYYSGNTHAGAGGRSIGYKQLTKGTSLYVCVGQGGAGSNNIGCRSSYNGGGGSTSGGGGGGGATHIALVSGTLVNIGASGKSNILLIAGGGGGCSLNATAYAGGGDTDATHTTTQSKGYAFGQGQTGGSGTGAGGGGLYGGKNTCGGSGYIGGVPAFVVGDVTYTPTTSIGGGSAGGSQSTSYIGKDGSATITYYARG